MAYTYLIGWTQMNKWYYGVRFTKSCLPTDLFISYFTSSNYVNDFIVENGMPDVIQIRKIFDDPNKAIKWEYRVLKKLKIHENEKWLNRNVGGNIVFDEQVRKKMSDKKKGKSPSNKGKRMSDEQRKKISDTRKLKGLGHKNAQYLPRMMGDSNPMRNDTVRKKFSEQVTGRRKRYNEDGSWSWYYPDK